MKKKLIILRGLPSSGKSTIAEKYKEKHKDSCFLCTTDEYWLRPDGTYDFNYDLIGSAHAWNFERTEKVMEIEQYTPWDAIIILDNVNSVFNSFRAYARLAFKHGFVVGIEYPKTDWAWDVEECFRRSRDEGRKVPYSTILRMYNEWEPHVKVIEKLNKLYKSTL